MRVRQAAGVEYEIRVARHSVFETERLQHDRHFAAVAIGNPGADDLAQFVQGCAGGVDLEAGKVEQGLQHLAFQLDRLLERASVFGQGMASARFAESLHQHAVFGIQKHHLTVDAVVTQTLYQCRQLAQLGSGAARIDTDGGQSACLCRLLRDIPDQGLEQAGGQVVDAVVADIFEYVQGDALAGTGEAR